jgi:hypothetical protein
MMLAMRHLPFRVRPKTLLFFAGRFPAVMISSFNNSAKASRVSAESQHLPAMKRLMCPLSIPVALQIA